MVELGRLITAIVTPFDEQGRVDYEKAKRLAKALLKSGSDGFVVGEGASWTLDGSIIYPLPGSMNGKESIRIEAPGIELHAGAAHLYASGRDVEVSLGGV